MSRTVRNQKFRYGTKQLVRPSILSCQLHESEWQIAIQGMTGTIHFYNWNTTSNPICFRGIKADYSRLCQAESIGL